MSREDAATAVANNDLTELLAADQLKIEQSAGNVFQVLIKTQEWSNLTTEQIRFRL